MRKSRWLAAVFGLVMVTLAAGPAHGEHGPWDGYCDGDKPVFTHPLPPGTQYEAYCSDGNLGIRLPPPPDAAPLPPRSTERPPDFLGGVVLEINGKEVVNPYRDVNPYIAASTSRTLVPIRLVTEAMGGTAEWFQEEEKVRVAWRDKYMEMVIGKPGALANGKRVVLDQPPILWKDRTLVPVRAVVEAFGAKVEYVEDRQLVTITLEGAVCPLRYCPPR